MDVPAIESCIEAAYSIYVDRIGKPPAPMLDDFEELVDAGYVRVASSTDGQLLGYERVFFSRPVGDAPVRK